MKKLLFLLVCVVVLAGCSMVRHTGEAVPDFSAVKRWSQTPEQTYIPDETNCPGYVGNYVYDLDYFISGRLGLKMNFEEFSRLDQRIEEIKESDLCCFVQTFDWGYLLIERLELITQTPCFKGRFRITVYKGEWGGEYTEFTLVKDNRNGQFYIIGSGPEGSNFIRQRVLE